MIDTTFARTFHVGERWSSGILNPAALIIRIPKSCASGDSALPGLESIVQDELKISFAISLLPKTFLSLFPDSQNFYKAGKFTTTSMTLYPQKSLSCVSSSDRTFSSLKSARIPMSISVRQLQVLGPSSTHYQPFAALSLNKMAPVWWEKTKKLFISEVRSFPPVQITNELKFSQDPSHPLPQGS
jgi:hypothetical protein